MLWAELREQDLLKSAPEPTLGFRVAVNGYQRNGWDAHLMHMVFNMAMGSYICYADAL